MNDRHKPSLIAYVVSDKAGNTFLSTHMSSNQIMSHEAAHKIIKALAYFYALHMPEEVALHNTEANKNWHSALYAKQSGD